MKTRERLKGLLRNFSLCLVGVANLSKSVAHGFPAWNPCDGHLFDHQS